MDDLCDSYENLIEEVEILRGQVTLDSKQKLEELKVHVQSHMERLEGIIRNIDLSLYHIDRNIRRERERIEWEASIRIRAHTTLEQLIQYFDLENKDQAEVLRRIQPQRWLYGNAREIFLSEYTPNTSTERNRAAIEGEFTILGTVRKGVRDSYKVTWYKQGCQARGSFWCSCPDQKFNGSKKNIYCKHISFLICRMSNLYDPEIFVTKQLSQPHHEAFKQKVSNAAILQQVQPPADVVPIASVIFTECGKSVEAEDSCPICYDNLLGTHLLGCPTCKNNIHRDCMEVWLERNQTCVYCRSSAWTHYVMNGP
jgi:hypothetical protein